MFSKEFIKQPYEMKSKSHHRAFYFSSPDSNQNITNLILAKGVTAFIQPDGVTYNGDLRYDDGRVRSAQFVTHADCCAFTRTPNVFYLFPIHKDDLKNVGLDEQDLIYWINKLNESGAGFEYLYFGEHETPKITAINGMYDWFYEHNYYLRDTNFYWVGVPKLGYKINRPYLHWVMLRYLISTEYSNQHSNYLGPKIPRLAYFNIPRITVMLHKEFGLPFFKALLYAHLANPFKSGNGLAYTDYMGINCGYSYDFRETYQAPCVNVTPEQFKWLWENSGDQLNQLLTRSFYTSVSYGRKPENMAGLTKLDAPYDCNVLYKLFHEGKYQDFINEIENSYKKHEEKVAI